MQFKRSIGTSGILLASVGAMVGSGWLFSAHYAAQTAGPAAIVSWFIAGFFVIMIALTFAELGTMLPLAGGQANYAHLTHGPLTGFIFAWIAWLSLIVLPPIEVQAAIQYGSNFFPSLVEQKGIGHHLTLSPSGYLTALCGMLFLTFVNAYGAAIMNRANIMFSVWKLSIPILAIILFFVYSQGIDHFSMPTHGGFAPNGWHGILAALATAGVVFSFSGFQVGVLMAAETKNPQKTIPKAIIASVIFGFLLYAFLQTAYLAALPEASLANGWGGLSFTGDAGPLAGLAALLGLFWLASLLYLDAVVAPMGAGIVYMASTTRVLYAMSAGGQLPKIFRSINGRGIPAIALWVSFALGMFAFLPFPNWQAMVSFLSSAMVASYAIVPVCLFALRKLQPELRRPFRLPFYKLFCVLTFYICNLMLYWCGWMIVSKLYIAIAFAIILYLTFFASRGGWDHIRAELRKTAWVFVYYTCILVLSYIGSYGGGLNYVGVGLDFALVAAISGLAFWMAQKSLIPRDSSIKYMNALTSHTPPEHVSTNATLQEQKAT